MQLKLNRWVLAAAIVAALGTAVSAEFELVCTECGDSDSGMATGDGSSSVHTSDGTADFGGGLAPSIESLDVDLMKDLRFTINAAEYTPTQETCAPAPCNFNYDAIRVTRLRVFVAAFRPSVFPAPRQVSDYCTSSFFPCDPLSTVQVGGSIGPDTPETQAEDLEAVIYKTDLLPPGGVQIGLGDSLTRRLSTRQWLTLQVIYWLAQHADPEAEHYIGFAVEVAAVDPNPLDGPSHIVPGSRILTIDVTKN